MSGRVDRALLATDAERCAERLLGMTLVRVLPSGERLAGVIVETEAYLGANDRASHTFGGRRTARNEAMYARAGTSYVYFTYGMHYCMNVVCGQEGEGTAVLLRALRPVEGVDAMRAARAGKIDPTRLRETDLCSGPAKLCQAMSIGRAQNGLDLVASQELWLEPPAPGLPTPVCTRAARVGVDSAGPEWAGAPLRFMVAGCPFVSRGGARSAR